MDEDPLGKALMGTSPKHIWARDGGGIANKSGARGVACVLGYKLTCTDRLFPVSFLTNARSLVNKMDEMKLRIVSAKIDSCVAIVTAESWLDNNSGSGASGALSSLGRTGLQPQRNTEVEVWLCTFITPGVQPRTSLGHTVLLIWNIWQ
ncbi:hypothetical protein L3Q82_022860 [Scortum barcoo]|uniref:Uncharacterized protein n=1 Tax=Scortum barcoo TaxID=214431 RepID=A0ACB8WYH8_9TELE|nr:hypothetical protein L3Q82_022860 [Scortum barcoo]